MMKPTKRTEELCIFVGLLLQFVYSLVTSFSTDVVTYLKTISPLVYQLHQTIKQYETGFANASEETEEHRSRCERPGSSTEEAKEQGVHQEEETGTTGNAGQAQSKIQGACSIKDE